MAVATRLRLVSFTSVVFAVPGGAILSYVKQRVSADRWSLTILTENNQSLYEATVLLELTSSLLIIHGLKVEVFVLSALLCS